MQMPQDLDLGNSYQTAYSQAAHLDVWLIQLAIILPSDPLIASHLSFGTVDVNLWISKYLILTTIIALPKASLIQSDPPAAYSVLLLRPYLLDRCHDLCLQLQPTTYTLIGLKFIKSSNIQSSSTLHSWKHTNNQARYIIGLYSFYRGNKHRAHDSYSVLLLSFRLSTSTSQASCQCVFFRN
jgi:hypothetical protein